MDLAAALGFNKSPESPEEERKKLQLYINLKLASSGQPTCVPDDAARERARRAGGKEKVPQATRSDDHRTYRCYLRGPDGIRELSPCGPGALGKLPGPRGQVNARPPSPRARLRSGWM